MIILFKNQSLVLTSIALPKILPGKFGVRTIGSYSRLSGCNITASLECLIRFRVALVSSSTNTAAISPS